MNQQQKSVFVSDVLDLVEMVPPGRVVTYQKLAAAAGYPYHSRMVGRIMSMAGSLRSASPAHRVVASCGKLTGKAAFGQRDEMARLLTAEGVAIKNDRVLNLKNVMWDPLAEI